LRAFSLGAFVGVDPPSDTIQGFRLRLLDAGEPTVHSGDLIQGLTQPRGLVALTATPIDPGSERRQFRFEAPERRVGRLRLALERLAARKTDYDRLIVALHYPPTNGQQGPSDFTRLIDEFKADACVYGHLHGEWTREGLTGKRGSATYHLVSADFVNFIPVRIL